MTALGRLPSNGHVRIRLRSVFCATDCHVMTVEVLRTGSQSVLCCFAPTPSHARRQSFTRASHQALQPAWAATISTRTRSRRILKTQSSSDDAIPDRRELKRRSAANRKYFSSLLKQQYSVGLVGITAFIAGAQLLQTVRRLSSNRDLDRVRMADRLFKAVLKNPKSKRRSKRKSRSRM